jgi:hypothetical protein
MSIKTLVNLGLVDGVDCIVVKKKNQEARFIPVSKCELHGVIVNAEQRSNGSCLYLLDDGTGVVDCLVWVDNATYSLPSLVPYDNEQGRDRIFRVGDVVQVFGKIKCVSIGCTRESIKVHGKEWKVQDCVREVHVTSMSAVPLNAQTNHWLRCMKFDRRAFIDTPIGSCVDPVRNGADVIGLLGPEIASKAVQRTNFPARDDAYGAWRVFGAGCKCKLPYLDSLLYCHCQASVVSLDPYFKFRDAVLNVLVQMEEDVTRSTSGQSTESNQLRFQYKTIVNNAELQKVAKQVVVNGSSAISIDRLFLQTFAALRKDGIVALLDHDADIYLLISRQGVLEPHCKMLLQRTRATFLERRALQVDEPRYLRNVSSARLQYVKKTITDNR